MCLTMPFRQTRGRRRANAASLADACPNCRHPKGAGGTRWGNLPMETWKINQK